MLKPKQGFFRKKFFVFLLGTLFISGFALFFWHAPKVFADSVTTANSATTAKPLPWYQQDIIDVIAGIVYVVVSLVGKLIGVFMGFWFSIMQYNDFIKAPFVVNGWIIIRDICNLGFILVLLAISLGSILHIDRYSYRVYLPKLLLMAILINFSKLIAGIIIDIGQVMMLAFGSHIINLGAGNIMNSLGITVLLSLSPNTPTKITAAAILGSVLLAAIFAIIAFIVIAIITITLVTRIVMLWILVVLSPIAYLFSASPVGKSYASQWWSEFIKWVFYGPILIFFVWLSFQAIQFSIKKTFLASAVSSSVGLTQIGDPAVMGSFVMGIVLLMASLATAQKLGGISGRMASSAYSGIVARGYRTVDWAKRTALVPWKATKYAGKGVVTGLDSYAATKTKSGMSPLQVLRNIKQLPKAIDREFIRRTEAKYGEGMSRAREIISGQREATLLQTILAKSSRPDYMAKNILNPRKENLFLSSRKRIEKAKQIQEELNKIEKEEEVLQQQEKFVQKVEKSGHKDEIQKFLRSNLKEKEKIMEETKKEIETKEEKLKKKEKMIEQTSKNVEKLQQDVKKLQRQLSLASPQEKDGYKQEINKKQQELEREKTKLNIAKEEIEKQKSLLEIEKEKYSLFKQATKGDYSDLDSLKRILETRKKEVTRQQQSLGKELFKYAPREIAELRMERSKKVREKLQELEDVEDTNTLISILDDALKKRDKATVEAVLRKTFSNGDYADVLRHYNYQTDYKGLQNFVDGLADEKSDVYSGFNQWQARYMGAGLSNILRNQGQYSAYGAFVNKNGMWKRTDPKQHISSVLERRNSSSLTKNLRDTGLLGYGYYTPEGEFKLSPAGLAYLKSIDNDRGRELVRKEMNQQVAAELSRHLDEIEEHVSKEMAQEIKKRVSGKSPEEITTEAISQKFAEWAKKLEDQLNNQFEKQEVKERTRRDKEKAEEKEEKRQEKAEEKKSSGSEEGPKIS